MSTVLITGGSGLIGSALTRALLAEGHAVRHLSRTPSIIPEAHGMGQTRGVQSGISVPTFIWDIQKGSLDPRALEGIDTIVHLSGATIVGRRWTRSRLKEIDDSRAGAARQLHRAVNEQGTAMKAFISASGVGWYGARTDDRWHTEDEPAATDTIGTITRNWEEAADLFADRCRVVKLRTPLVLAREGGALPRLIAPTRWTFGVPLGSGRQWWPWIHINDLVSAYLRAIDHPAMHGSYNVCTPDQPDNRTFMRTLAHAMRRPYMPIGVPGFALKAVMGEQAVLLLEGSRCAAEHAKAAGVTIQHRDLEPALKLLLQ